VSFATFALSRTVTGFHSKLQVNWALRLSISFGDFVSVESLLAMLIERRGMKIALVRESRPGETRVGLTPDAVKALVSDGWDVDVQRDAGLLAHYTNDSTRRSEPTSLTTPWATSPFASTPERRGSQPAQGRFAAPVISVAPVVSRRRESLNERRITVLSFDLLHAYRARSTWMPQFPVNGLGYRAALAARRISTVLPAADHRRRNNSPAKVLVMGVGVAGLQAIATAKRLGAKVRAYDVRSAAKEEAESAGAVFVQLGVTATRRGLRA